MKVNKPIIIIGTGRSGSTIFHNVFARYEKLAWISSLSNNTPSQLKKHQLLMKSIDLPIIGNKLIDKFLVGEGYKFWDYYANGFSVPCRDLTKDDLSIKFRKNLNVGMSKLLCKSRNRLLLKITGWPRITYLKAAFPDAKFIHIIRDGRAVANSMLNIDFWWGWRGPHNWRWGELPEQYHSEWLEHNKSFIALAAIEWKILMDALEEGKKPLTEKNYLEIRYEDLCASPIKEFEKVLKFSELEMTDKFQKIINQTKFRNTNSKWENELNDKQKTILNEVLYDYLVKYGYE